MGFLDQAVSSIIIGALISAVAFIPIVWFQFVRFGTISASRVAWLVAGMVYLTALISYTLFPLPDTSGDFCDAHPRRFYLNPLTYFRDMWHEFGGDWAAMLDSWAMLQMVLNVALFVPLGIICHQLWNSNVFVGTLVGFGMSLLVELTQYTGNWWLEPCGYRVADVNDLMTNTFGALLGTVGASLLPRLAKDAGDLESERNVARPVTRARRWLGQLFDVLYFMVTQLFATMAIAAVVLIYIVLGPGKETAGLEILADVGGELTNVLSRGWIQVAITGLCLLVVLVPAFCGSGASLGQRTVHLKPVARDHSRVRLVIRAVVVQGFLVAASGMTNVLPDLSDVLSLPMLGLVMFSLLGVVLSPRGFSFALTGCKLVDSRTVDEGE